MTQNIQIVVLALLKIFQHQQAKANGVCSAPSHVWHECLGIKGEGKSSGLKKENTNDKAREAGPIVRSSQIRGNPIGYTHDSL